MLQPSPPPRSPGGVDIHQGDPIDEFIDATHVNEDVQPLEVGLCLQYMLDFVKTEQLDFFVVNGWHISIFDSSGHCSNHCVLTVLCDAALATLTKYANNVLSCYSRHHLTTTNCHRRGRLGEVIFARATQ